MVFKLLFVSDVCSFLKKFILKSFLVPVYFITLCPSGWQCNTWKHSRRAARLRSKAGKGDFSSRWVGQIRWAPSAMAGLVQLSKEGQVVPQLLKGHLAPPKWRANPAVCTRHSQASKNPTTRPHLSPHCCWCSLCSAWASCQCAATKQHQQVLLLFSREPIPAHPYLVFLFFVPPLPRVASVGDKLKPLCSEKRRKSFHKKYIPSNRLMPPARVTALLRLSVFGTDGANILTLRRRVTPNILTVNGSWEQLPSPYTHLTVHRGFQLHKN